MKPFVKRGKNDRNDAEAISEAAARPSMSSVVVRSAEQQAEAVPDAAKEMLAFLGARVAQLDELVETRSVCGWHRRAGPFAAKELFRRMWHGRSE